MVATGVLPSQLSTASAQSQADIKPGVKSPPFKKGDNKVDIMYAKCMLYFLISVHIMDKTTRRLPSVAAMLGHVT